MNAIGTERGGELPPQLAPLPLAPEEAARQAVLETYDRHQSDIYTFLLAATRDVGVAQDLLQDTFLRLFREAANDRMPDNQRAWLYRVASNLVLSRGRRGQTAKRWTERQQGVEPRVASPEDSYVERERQAIVMECLEQVSPDARLGLLMAAHGFSGPEIADALGRSPLAVRSLLCRSRLRLRELLVASGVAP